MIFSEGTSLNFTTPPTTTAHATTSTQHTPPGQGLFFVNNRAAVIGLDVVDAVEKYFDFTGFTYAAPVKVRVLMGPVGLFEFPSEHDREFKVKRIKGEYVLC